MKISKIMIRILLLVVVLSAFNGQTIAQDSPDFDKECFLIGTLDDYMGHQQSFTVKLDIDSGFIEYYTDKEKITPDSSCYQRVDFYFQQEEKIASLIVSLFRNEYPDLILKNSGAQEGRAIYIYSASLSKVVDGYFDYKPTGRTIHLDTIYSGHLMKDKIITHKQKTSFLLGAFLRYGIATDSKEYVLSIPNSRGKAELCEEILKEFGCKNVVYTILKDYIPVGHKVSFEPSEEVGKIIKKLDKK
jgi:hypothetical protein